MRPKALPANPPASREGRSIHSVRQSTAARTTELASAESGDSAQRELRGDTPAQGLQQTHSDQRRRL